MDIELASMKDLLEELSNRAIAQRITLLTAMQGSSSGTDSGYAIMNFNGKIGEFVDIVANAGIEIVEQSEGALTTPLLAQHIIVRMRQLSEEE